MMPKGPSSDPAGAAGAPAGRVRRPGKRTAGAGPRSRARAADPLRDIDEALRQGERRYRELVQDANSAILRWTREGRITFFNEFAQKFFGWKAEEVIGRHVNLLVPDKESTGADLTGLAQDIVDHPERHVNNVNENVCRDGRRVWMTWTNRAIRDAAGEVREIVAVGSDITELRRAEIALQESEEKFRSAFANAAIGFAMATPDGRFVDANPAYCRITGFRIEELRRMTVPQVIHPEDAGANMRQIERMLAGEITNFVLENRYAAKDGGSVWVRKSVSLVRSARGAPQWIIALVEDVTDRRAAEEALREARDDMGRAQAVGQIGSWRLDVQRNVLTWSEENHRIFGVAPGTPLTYETFLGLVHPEDREYVHRKWTAGMAGAPYDIEHRLQVNGRVKWVREKAFLEYDGAGRLAGGFGITQDITERREAEEALRASEERYRGLFEAMSEGFALHETILDAGGNPCDYRFLEVNPAFERLTGLKRAELVGRRVREVLPGIEDHWIEAFGRVALTGEPRNIEEFSGTLDRWYNVFAYRPAPALFAVVFTDVTDRKLGEAALKRMNETLEQRVAERTALADSRARQLQELSVKLIEAEERERRQIAQLLHDDLQQVLAAARMQLDTARESLPADALLASASCLLEDSMQKARRLSHDLSPAVLYHSGLIPALKWLADHLQEKFGLKVELETGPAQLFEESPVKPFLFRAVQELLFNVIKHSGKKIATVALAAAEERLAITVGDRGRGFATEALDACEAVAGFGLMSIRERARFVGGDLVLESAPGKGSRVTLRVPARLAPPGEPRPPAEGKRDPAPIEPAAEGIRVLFVDDHPVMRQGLINFLKSQPGIRVAGEAANGLEAVARARALHPDLVLMDISMPEMDGIEATRRIKADLPRTKVVALSVHEGEHLAARMRAAGADAFVSKAASTEELLRVIYDVASEGGRP